MITLINLLLIIYAISNIIALFIFGGFLNIKYYKSLENLDVSKLRLSTVTFSTIVYNDKLYIHKVSSILFFKYYISGYGVIPRGTKASKKIDEYFNTLFS